MTFYKPRRRAYPLYDMISRAQREKEEGPLCELAKVLGLTDPFLLIWSFHPEMMLINRLFKRVSWDEGLGCYGWMMSCTWSHEICKESSWSSLSTSAEGVFRTCLRSAQEIFCSFMMLFIFQVSCATSSHFPLYVTTTIVWRYELRTRHPPLCHLPFTSLTVPHHPSRFKSVDYL